MLVSEMVSNDCVILLGGFTARNDPINLGVPGGALSLLFFGHFPLRQYIDDTTSFSDDKFQQIKKEFWKSYDILYRVVQKKK